MLHSIYKQPIMDQHTNIEALRSRIAAIDSEAGETVTTLCYKYRPRVIFNMGEHPDEVKISEQISNRLKSTLSLKVDYFGFIFNDPAVRQSVKKRTALIPHYRESMATENIKRIAERIVKYWDRPVENSAQLLQEHTWKVYESRG